MKNINKFLLWLLLSIPYMDLMHMFLHNSCQHRHNLFHKCSYHLYNCHRCRSWFLHTCSRKHFQHKRSQPCILYRILYVHRWLQPQRFRLLSLLKIQKQVNSKISSHKNSWSTFKSFPKINKEVMDICVKKKKQFFTALYEAIEDWIEVIRK